ncbi:MAG: hypothetical protein OXF79_20160 [Chloroflexi bacterium]|nr:hypothetical protein [Chloroflexota bacterium]
MPQVPPATENDTQAFCDQCQWVYECWLTHSHVFECLPARLQEERNVPVGEFVETSVGRCLGRLNEISQQYSILQVAKLHDPAQQGANENLSIDFFVRQNFWSKDEKSAIAGIATELDVLYRKILDARNKILAHNDRSAFLNDIPLGSFQEGEDEIYFGALGRLCSIIWNKFPNRSWPYGNRVFDFTKSGLEGDPLCASTDSKELGNLIVAAFPKTADDTKPT